MGGNGCVDVGRPFAFMRDSILLLFVTSIPDFDGSCAEGLIGMDRVLVLLPSLSARQPCSVTIGEFNLIDRLDLGSNGPTFGDMPIPAGGFTADSKWAEICAATCAERGYYLPRCLPPPGPPLIPASPALPTPPGPPPSTCANTPTAFPGGQAALGAPSGECTSFLLSAAATALSAFDGNDLAAVPPMAGVSQACSDGATVAVVQEVFSRFGYDWPAPDGFTGDSRLNEICKLTCLGFGLNREVPSAPAGCELPPLAPPLDVSSLSCDADMPEIFANFAPLFELVGQQEPSCEGYMALTQLAGRSWTIKDNVRGGHLCLAGKWACFCSTSLEEEIRFWEDHDLMLRLPLPEPLSRRPLKLVGARRPHGHPTDQRPPRPLSSSVLHGLGE